MCYFWHERGGGSPDPSHRYPSVPPRPPPSDLSRPRGGCGKLAEKNFRTACDRLHSRGCCSSPPRAGRVNAGGGVSGVFLRGSVRTPMPAPRPPRHEIAPGAAVGAPNRAENTGFFQEKTGPKNGRSSGVRGTGLSRSPPGVDRRRGGREVHGGLLQHNHEPLEPPPRPSISVPRPGAPPAPPPALSRAQS